MKLTLAHYYKLIEESFLSRDILYRLSKVSKSVDLKNFFFEQAQKRELYAVELKTALSYNYSLENFSSVFAKMILKNKFRKSILATFLNRSDKALVNAFNELFIADINIYGKIIMDTKEEISFYKMLINQHSDLRDALKSSMTLIPKVAA